MKTEIRVRRVLEAKWETFNFFRNQKTARKVAKIYPPELILSTNCRERPGEAESGLECISSISFQS